MSGKPGEDGDQGRSKERSWPMLWLSGAWVLPFLGISFGIFPGSAFARAVASILAVLAAPFPHLLYPHRQRGRLAARAAKAGGRGGATEAATGDCPLPHGAAAGGVAGRRPAGAALAPTDASGPVHGGLHARVQQSAGDCGGAASKCCSMSARRTRRSAPIWSRCSKRRAT